jgi:hypothetical protein
LGAAYAILDGTHRIIGTLSGTKKLVAIVAASLIDAVCRAIGERSHAGLGVTG